MTRRSARRGHPARAASGVATALTLALFVTLALPAFASALPVQLSATALSASPTPGAEGDTRSSGQGPGFVGAPLLAIGGVIGIGLTSLLLTVAYVRLTDASRSSRPRGAPPGADERRRP